MRTTAAVLSFSLLANLVLVPAVHAIPAITCHCFTDRSYDPARPAAADPYFLATTANTFLAVALNVEKRSIVMMKQKGVGSDDLWVAAWAAARSGGSVEQLLGAKQKNESWQKALAASGVDVKTLGPRVSTALAGGAPAVAQAVVDELLLQHRLLPERELGALRKSWATNQEVIIASLLAIRTKQPAKQILSDVKKGAKTWGALLHHAGIAPADLQKEFSVLMKGR